MLAPEREVPGNTAATNWATPTAAATRQVTSLVKRRPFNQRSTNRKAIPPRNRAEAMGQSVSGNFKPPHLSAKPPIAVTTNAKTILYA